MNEIDLLEPLTQILRVARVLVPRLLAALIVMIAGALVAWLIRAVVGRGLAIVRFDRLCDRLGVTTLLSRGGIVQSPSRLAGAMTGGIVIVIAAILSIASLNLGVTNSLLNRFALFLPNLFVALVILIGGMLAAKFVQRAVLIALVNAQIAGARIVSGAIGTGVIVFTLAVALEQIGVGVRIVLAAFSILFGGVTIALAVAFGLAGRDMAARFLERHLSSHKDEEKDDKGMSHL